MGVPIYTQIHDKIKSDIEKMVYKVGERLPSERELSQRFKVTRTTLRQAVSALCDEGILERKIGSGTYVVGKRVRERMRGTTSFTEIITGQGKEPSSKVLSYSKSVANDVERQRLGLTPRSPVVRMERIRYANKIPICFEVACIPAQIIENYQKNEVAHHFFATLQEHGKVIARSEQTISSKNASQELADDLNVKVGTALLTVSQVSYFSDERAFEYVLSYYVGERFEFYLER